MGLQLFVSGSASQVLVAGGVTFPLSGLLDSAELYDPSSGVWSPTGSLRAPRAWHTASVLPSGLVLVAGGRSTSTNGDTQASAELYDPNIRLWVIAPGMGTQRERHTATLITVPGSPAYQEVMVAGGRIRLPVSGVAYTNGTEAYGPL